MLLASVIGHATSTIKHSSFHGCTMLVAQLLGGTGAPEGDAVIAIDRLGAGIGQTVLLNLDGKAGREYVGNDKSPIRHFVVGIVDEPLVQKELAEQQ